jgi:hypothetical protein
MPMFRLALVFTLLAPGVGKAETKVNMPPVGFRFTTQADGEFTAKPDGNSGTNSKIHSVTHHEVVASDGWTIQTRNEGTVAGASADASTFSGKTTYQLFFLTHSETTHSATDQPAIVSGSTWDCPGDGLDQFYPRGAATQVSVACKFTAKVSGRVVGPQPLTVSFSDLGPAHDTTLAGTFEVRKIVVRTSLAEAGVTNEITYDFAPALGISVVQETKISTPHGETVTHTEVADFTPPP